MAEVVIFGGGLVGTSAARAFVEQGATVLVVDTQPDAEHFGRFGPPRGASLRRGDARDPASASAALTDETKVLVIALGPLGQAASSDPAAARDVNVEAAAAVCGAAIASGIKRVVYLSTFAVYGAREGSTQETVEPAPVTPYGKAKLAGELAAAPFRNEGLDVRIVRPCGLYGPLKHGSGSRSGRLIQQLCRDAAGNRPIHLRADLVDEYLYVKDLSRALVLVSFDAAIRDEFIYNIGAGRRTTARDLSDALRAVFPSVRVSVEGNEDAIGSSGVALDTTLVRDSFDFAPAYSLSEGLRDYVAESGDAL